MNHFDNDRTPNIPAHPMNHRGGFRYLVARTESLENDFTAATDIPVANGSVSAYNFHTLLRLCRRPAAQIVVDYLDGYVYLISYDPERAEAVIKCNADAEREYDKWRKRVAKQCQTGTGTLSLERALDHDSEDNTLAEHIASSIKASDADLNADADELFLQAVSYLEDRDRQFMLDYYAAGCNCAELARRKGIDKSGVAKRLKRLRDRFLAALDAANNSF